MRPTPIAYALLAGLLSGPAVAQSALQEKKSDDQFFISQINAATIPFDATANIAQIGLFENSDGVTITQEGDGNRASLDTPGLPEGADAGTAISQHGSGNMASVFVQGTGNASQIRQSGTGNSADLTQAREFFSAGGNRAAISQSGSGNTATATQFTQATLVLSAQTENRLSIRQEGGFGNHAQGTQIGMSNSGSISQTGSLNFAQLDQFGDLNNAMIVQEGTGLIAQSLQIGIATQPIFIHQTAGAPPVSITRTGQTGE